MADAVDLIFNSTRIRKRRTALATIAGTLVYALAFIAAMGQVPAQGDDKVVSASAAKPAGDLYERMNKAHAAASRLQELDRQSWDGLKEGEFEAAIATRLEIVELARAEYGTAHWRTKGAEAYAAAFQSILALAREKKQIICEARKADVMAQTMRSRGNAVSARTHARQADAKYVQVLGHEHLFSLSCRLRLAQCECAMGDFEFAGEHVSEVVDNYRKQFGDADPALAHALDLQALVELKLNQREAAERHFRQALDIIEPVVRNNYDFDTLEIYAHATVVLAVILNDRQDYLEAEPLARRASDVYVAGLPGSATAFVESQVQVARSLSGQGKQNDAELIFASLLKMLRPEPPPQLVASVLAGYAGHLRSVHRDADGELLETRAKQLFPQVEVFSRKSGIVPASAEKPAEPTRK